MEEQRPSKLKVKSAIVMNGRESNRSHPPAEVEALLKDPRVLAMTENPPGFPVARILLEPAIPARKEASRYVQFSVDYPPDRTGEVVWSNKPQDIGLTFFIGDGLGFSYLREKPSFRETGRKQKRYPDIRPYLGFYVASSRFVEAVRTFDAEAIETAELDWTFSDASRVDGYEFLDFVRCIPAIDYGNSEAIVEKANGQTSFVRAGPLRSLKPDLPERFHLFRDEFLRDEIFISRELGRALRAQGLTGFGFAGLAGVESPCP